MANEKSQKIPLKFFCETCHYNTSSNKDYNKHLLTAKHFRLTNTKGFTNENPQKSQTHNKYLCNCGRAYKHMSSLCKHKNKCEFIEIENKTLHDEISDKELIVLLLHL